MRKLSERIERGMKLYPEVKPTKRTTFQWEGDMIVKACALGYIYLEHFGLDACNTRYHELVLPQEVKDQENDVYHALGAGLTDLNDADGTFATLRTLKDAGL